MPSLTENNIIKLAEIKKVLRQLGLDILNNSCMIKYLQIYIITNFLFKT